MGLNVTDLAEREWQLLAEMARPHPNACLEVETVYSLGERGLVQECDGGWTITADGFAALRSHGIHHALREDSEGG